MLDPAATKISARCLYINFARGWGGLEMFSANLFDWLSARGAMILFMVRRGTKLQARLAMSRFADRVIAVDPLPYCDPRVLFAIRRTLRRHSLSIVHTFKSSDVFFSVLATLGWRRAAAKRVHHLQMLPKHSRRDPLHAFVYRRLDLLLTITRQIAERVMRLWPVSPLAVRTLYYGIDAAPFCEAAARAGELREKLGVSGSPLLGIVGQICEIKGQMLVLRAFAELRKSFPQAALIIAGVPPAGSEQYAAALQAFVAEQHLAPAVTLIGFCPKVPELLAALDIFVLGSVAEPFGLVVLEAMTAGVPVVASNAGGIPEVITDGENGILYRPQDEQSLLEALQRACTLSKAERARMIAAAHLVVAQRFSLARHIGEMAELYKLLLAEPVR